jgi:hypothetical protein
VNLQNTRKPEAKTWAFGKGETVDAFQGHHSEWNLGSPGGWDYQRITQIIGKAVWERLQAVTSLDVRLDFDHPRLYPVFGFVRLLLETHRAREGSNPGVIAVVAEEETLQEVTENRNLALHLDAIEGISGVLASPRQIECSRGRVSYRGRPVSLIFMDFNTDVLLDLHRSHGLDPLLQAVREGRVINPRGMEPINNKAMFEVITGPHHSRFHPEIVQRTPWTRRFYPRSTIGPHGEDIPDLVAWTRSHWPSLVLKPVRGYSGKGVLVGGPEIDPDPCLEQALGQGDYILQEKIPLSLWAEDIPAVQEDRLLLERVQTDFRCLIGPEEVFGFLGRFGGVPTNVGSGGGVQPLAVLPEDIDVRRAAEAINQAVLKAPVQEVAAIAAMRDEMAVDHRFTYLLGPIRIALRPRLLTPSHLQALEHYGRRLWQDCLTLEQMWLEGLLDEYTHIDAEELSISRMDPWKGSAAIIASDGLFSFGAHPMG